MMNLNISSRLQRGVTLISLMVGLFISMLCILASLTLYKNLIHVATESKIDTLHDGQLAAVMLTIQLELQSAGYGIDNAGLNDVVRRKVEGANSDTIELFWRYLGDEDYICRGLKEEAETDPETGLVYRVLKLRNVLSGCDATSTLTGMAWNDVAVLGRWPIISGLKQHIDLQGTLLEFDIASVQCSPFGAMDPQAHLRVRVSAPNSSVLNEVSGAQLNQYDYCLPNTAG